MKQGMEPFLVLNRTICSKSASWGYWYPIGANQTKHAL